MFRKRQALVADVEHIPEDVIAAIPDVAAASANPVSAFRHVEPGPDAPRGAAPEAPAKPARAHATGSAELDVGGLVAEVRRQMDSVFARELAKVESSLACQMQRVEDDLAAARASLEALRDENRQLAAAKAEAERKLQAIRDLMKAAEDL